ncbi:MAG: hypothetical protein JEY99_13580 [Spirochaetales bacterium]|nr:hypothetical protein [Spirochaetales bacterium]
MKKSFFCLLLNILLFSSLSFAEEAGEVKYFRSNPSGMALEEIGPYLKDENEWVLEIKERDFEEHRNLYRDDRLISENIRYFRDEEIIRVIDKEEGFVTESVYEDSLLRSETITGGGPVERRDYFYLGRMVNRIEFSLDGQASYTDKYFLDRRGRLIRVTRSFPDEDVITARYGYTGGELSREWHEGQGREELFRITGGEVSGRSEWMDGALVSSESWEIIDGEEVLKILYPGEDLEIYRHFDEQERLIKETVITGEEREIITYLWDEDNVIEKIIRGGGRKERWEYLWDKNALYSEKVYRNNSPVKKLIYPEEGVRWEVTYRNGEVLATVVYENDIPTETYFGEELVDEFKPDFDWGGGTEGESDGNSNRGEPDESAEKVLRLELN